MDPEGFPRRLAETGAVDHGAIRVYGTSAEPLAIPVLREFLAGREEAGDAASSTNWGRVYAAVRALGNIGGVEAVETLQALLVNLEGQQERNPGPLARGRMDKMIGATRAALRGLEKV